MNSRRTFQLCVKNSQAHLKQELALFHGRPGKTKKVFFVEQNKAFQEESDDDSNNDNDADDNDDNDDSNDDNDNDDNDDSNDDNADANAGNN